ncbi:hypothetical protein [Paraburkholderia bannensis]|uniref:hypothetical protein n=1 Tax=Paraburkholderia bannensis TaxID=765414 RepID=UPI002AB0810A|nr:hypothetical protein [Paraburkholderia bannensis]
MTSNIKRLASMLAELERVEWTVSLASVLASPEAVEIGGYPKSDRASFVLDRAIMRKENSERRGLQTFGLDSLIATLGALSPDTNLESYAVKNDKYTGSCFVFEGKLIGCEFVARGLAQTIQFRG